MNSQQLRMVQAEAGLQAQSAILGTKWYELPLLVPEPMFLVIHENPHWPDQVLPALALGPDLADPPKGTKIIPIL